MSDMPPPTPPGSTPGPARNGCLTALMVVAGVILLLPGVCALLFGGASVFGGGRIDSEIAPLIFLGLVVGIGGVALIWAAVRGRKSPPQP